MYLWINWTWDYTFISELNEGKMKNGVGITTDTTVNDLMKKTNIKLAVKCQKSYQMEKGE